MKILVRRSGGFAGVSETLHDVDTHQIGGAAAAELERLVLDVESAERARSDKDRPAGADFFAFEITLTDRNGERTIIIPDDGSAPAALAHELLDALSRLAHR